MPFISAAIGAALSIGSGVIGSKKARKARHKQSKRLKRAVNLTQSIMGKGFDQQEALSRLGTQQQLAGVDAALREQDRASRESSRMAIDRGTQLGEASKQRMSDLGLDTSTVGEQRQQAVGSQTTRELAGINADAAAARGQLQMGRAGIEAGGTQDLANLAAQRSQLMSSLGQMGLLGGQQLGQFNIGGWSQPNALESALPGIAANFGDAFTQWREQQNQQDMLNQIFGLGGGFGMRPGGRGFTGPGAMGQRPPADLNLNSFVT